MIKKFAIAAALTAATLVMGGSAFADSSAVGSDDWATIHWTAKHGNCSVQDHTRVCTNY